MSESLSYGRISMAITMGTSIRKHSSSAFIWVQEETMYIYMSQDRIGTISAMTKIRYNAFMMEIAPDRWAMDMLAIYCHVHGYLDPTRGRGCLRRDLSSMEVDDIKNHMMLLGIGIPRFSIMNRHDNNIAIMIDMDRAPLLRRLNLDHQIGVETMAYLE